MRNIKKIVFVAALLLALVGGAGQASADPGTVGPSIKIAPAGITWEGADIQLSAGITWE